MSNNLNDLKFSLTGKMTYILLNINNLNKEIVLLENQMKTYKNTIHYHSLKNSKDILNNKIKCLKKEFIKEFRLENKEEINKYLNLIKKVWKYLFFCA